MAAHSGRQNSTQHGRIHARSDSVTDRSPAGHAVNIEPVSQFNASILKLDFPERIGIEHIVAAGRNG